MPMTLKLGLQHWVLKYYQVCSKNNPGLTVTCFTARSNLVPYALNGKKENNGCFQKLLASII